MSSNSKFWLSVVGVVALLVAIALLRAWAYDWNWFCALDLAECRVSP